MKRAICFGIVLVICTWASIAAITRANTLNDTLRLMARAFLASPQIVEAEIDYSDKSVTFVTDTGETFTSYPDNLHTMLQNADSDKQRQDLLDENVTNRLASIFEAITSDGVDIERLFPALRHKGIARFGDRPLLSVPFIGDVSVFVIEDMPHGISFLTQADLDHLSLTQGALFERAMANIYAQNWQPEFLGGDGLYVLRLDGNHEATLMLVPEIWQQLDAQMKDVVAVVIARDLVLVADTGVDGALTRLRDVLLKREDTVSYPISNQLLIWRKDHWAAFE
ncbi:MAG: hypothetical protein ABJR46_09055 [Tateyamaria sp.]|uniref:hypothetical protein n=1 Tax=Tateyamaria sp. TaxID=1929288 RepID=UPI00329E3FAF